MEEAFGYVLFAVVIVAAIVAVATFAGARRSYDQIGRGGLSLNEDLDRRPSGPAVPPAVAAAERDAEIRQMIGARNARREARGQEPLDVDEEVRRLTGPTVDPGLRDEVRVLVEARNRRRVRQGKEPLDVEQEVERQLREIANG
jgi:hypothetical protein